MGRRTAGTVVAQDDTDYLSDESDFYGDKAMKEELERKVNTFSTSEWWENKAASVTEMANANVASTTAIQSATLYNPYEGQSCGRQLGETVDEFLHRLPPATSSISNDLHWIFIANPFWKVSKSSHGESGHKEIPVETPFQTDNEWRKFKKLGESLLEEMSELKLKIEKRYAGRAKSTITKALNVQKEIIIQKILDTAVELHCTSGKWMLFCQPDDVNAVWSVIARATASNDLGTAAKVAPDDGNERKPRLMCIYTKDFKDMEDVCRVLHKLRSLGLVETKGKPIYYKCDAYTYLDLNSGNVWNIKASLYSSADLLKPADQKSKEGKEDGFFNKKRVDDDWRSLEWE